MSNDSAVLTRVGSLYTARYDEQGKVRTLFAAYQASAFSQREAVCALWAKLDEDGIERPTEFALSGELHKEQLIRR